MSADALFEYALGSGTQRLLISELPPASAADDGHSKAFHEKAVHDITGYSVWGSSVVLSRFVCEQAGRDLLAGANVLELGAGCGLAGLAAAQRGGAASVTLTDFNAATVANLTANAERNAAACVPCRLHTAAFDWDAPPPWEQPRAFDVVLGSDLVYTRSYARKLAAVLNACVAAGGAFALATPAQREGLPTLAAALAAAGWRLELEAEAGEAWRSNPLAGDELRYTDHFPELAMRSCAYPLLLRVWRRGGLGGGAGDE